MKEADMVARLDEFDRRLERIEGMIAALIDHLDANGPNVEPSGDALAM